MPPSDIAPVGGASPAEPAPTLVPAAAEQIAIPQVTLPDVSDQAGEQPERPSDWTPPPPGPVSGQLFQTPTDAPLGFTGRSSVLPRETQTTRTSSPSRTAGASASRSGTATARAIRRATTTPTSAGHWWDPFNQNVLKGDYPIIGQHTFLEHHRDQPVASSKAAQVPTATTPFESTRGPFQEEFFGSPNQFVYTQNFVALASTCSTATPPSSRSTGGSS